MRYTYAGGFKSRAAAEMALEGMFAAGEVSEGERPKVEKIGGKWAVTLEG